MLSLAEQFGFAVIEDDVYGDLHEARGCGWRRSMACAMSFTSAATRSSSDRRCEWAISRRTLLWCRSFVERKVLSVLSGSSLLEAFVSEVLDSGRYKRHVDQLRARLARMRRDARQALESAGIQFDAHVGEGMFLWGRLPDNSTPVDELVRRAGEIHPSGQRLPVLPVAELTSGFDSTRRTAPRLR